MNKNSHYRFANKGKSPITSSGKSHGMVQYEYYSGINLFFHVVQKLECNFV